MAEPLRRNAELGDKSIVDPLAGDFHVFACDQRGHGFSSLPATPGLALNWTVFRDDLIGYLRCIADVPVILAGHSMGATASFMAAAAAPDRVRALVLFEPVLMTPMPRQGANPSPDLAERSLKRRATFPSPDVAFDSWRGRGIFRAWSDQMVEDYVHGGLKPLCDGTWALACTPAWESECFRETPVNISRFAPAVRCPLTIVYGTIASTSFETEIAAIVRGRPDTRVVKVEGASHFLPMEHPEIVRDEIARLLTTWP
jgi:pimeloyl-ACP methyl ester carboxylesterase